MKLFLLFTLLISTQATVTELTADNFDDSVKGNKAFVKFYAPWCGHCKKLAPTWEEVATRLVGEINVAKVDASQDRSLATRFDIKGFPTVLFLSVLS